MAGDKVHEDAGKSRGVIYAFKEGGVSIEAPAFNSGVRYLIATQEGSGAWPAGVTETKRPSEFARPDGKPIFGQVVKLLQQNPNLALEI